MTRRRFELTDKEWTILEPLLPNKPRGVPRVDDRRVINGILWRFRTGSPWADPKLPNRAAQPNVRRTMFPTICGTFVGQVCVAVGATVFVTVTNNYGRFSGIIARQPCVTVAEIVVKSVA